jgi:Tol biopolymer transport system component
MGMPAWHPTGELLAYVAAGSIESSESPADRDIYSYDLHANRIDPISVGTTDDIQPTWSPTDLRMLAFCRVEGRRQQIWLIRFDNQGQSAETKLTTAGGKHPVWLPDGSGLVYENNGQLWTVAMNRTATSTTEFNPVKVNGKPVFGHRPDVALDQ